VPVLNVLYDGNTCGPYRDWLYSEDCFQATGTDVPSSGSGVRVASSAPATFCESSVDAGNFKGIAIYDQVRLTTNVSTRLEAMKTTVSRSACGIRPYR